MTTTAAPAWAKGQDVAVVKEVSGLFRDFEKAVVQGAFTRVSDLDVVEWLSKGQLQLVRAGGMAPGSGGQLLAALVVVQPKVRTPLRGFGMGDTLAYTPGDQVLRRVAWLPGAVLDASRLVATALAAPDRISWVETWLEHPELRGMYGARDLVYVCTRIKSSSELQGVYAYVPPHRNMASAVVPPAERCGLTRIAPAMESVANLAHELGALGDWAVHYSSYQKGSTWQALALQGYGPAGGPWDAEFIGKPSEMGKKWGKENPNTLQWVAGTTGLGAGLVGQAAELVLADLGLQPHMCDRIRLMRLTPGGGELTRHADLDKDAGVADGKLMRIHVPVITNPAVVFEQWLLDASVQRGSMGLAEAWYLDQRKPHTARNGGTTDRIHLVADVYADDHMRQLLLQGQPLPVAEEA